MLAPTARAVGSVPFTENALLEMLNWPTSTGDVPSFRIDTPRDTGVPTLTSPKSIVDGLTTKKVDVFELVDENGWELDPQPVTPMLSTMAAIPNAAARLAIRLFALFFVCGTSVRHAVEVSSTSYCEKVRNLNIDITCAIEIWYSRRPIRKAPPDTSAGVRIYRVLRLTRSRIDPARG